VADNFAKNERKNQFRSTDSIGERRRIKNLIRDGRSAGMANDDAPIKGRDPSQNIEDRKERIFKQYEQDIYLKYGEKPDSTAISIREKQIGLHTEKGKVGIVISNKGSLFLQGKMVMKVSGKNIIKGDYTENDDSSAKYTGMGGAIGGSAGIAVPHIHMHRHSVKPAYLRRMPNVELISGMMSMLEKFKKLIS